MSSIKDRATSALYAGMVALLIIAPGRSTAQQSTDILGVLSSYSTIKGDNLLDVAQRFELGYIELVAANPGINPWVPGSGVEILLPAAHVLPDTAREGIVINLADLRLYWFPPDGQAPRSYPIGAGRVGMTTPVGQTRVVRKRANPTWFPTTATREDNPELPVAVPPGRNNPLGRHALYLDWPSYVIHGTNDPDGVGRRISRGCLRLYSAHIKTLFAEVPIGTKVTIIDQPAKLGWRAEQLFLEIHPAGNEIDELEETGRFVGRPIVNLVDAIREKAGAQQERVDWNSVDIIDTRRRGIPVQITR